MEAKLEYLRTFQRISLPRNSSRRFSGPAAAAAPASPPAAILAGGDATAPAAEAAGGGGGAAAEAAARGLGPAAVPPLPSANGGAVDAATDGDAAAEATGGGGVDADEDGGGVGGGQRRRRPARWRRGPARAVGAGRDSSRGWHPAASVALPLPNCAPPPSAAVSAPVACRPSKRPGRRLTGRRTLWRWLRVSNRRRPQQGLADVCFM